MAAEEGPRSSTRNGSDAATAAAAEEEEGDEGQEQQAAELAAGVGSSCFVGGHCSMRFPSLREIWNSFFFFWKFVGFIYIYQRKKLKNIYIFFIYIRNFLMWVWKCRD